MIYKVFRCQNAPDHIDLKCDRCKVIFYHGNPHAEEKGKHYCDECALISGIWTNDKYLSCYIGIYPSPRDYKVGIRDNKIYVIPKNTKFDWDKKTKDYRRLKKYRLWREAVFERDNYTCKNCTVIGGELNVHHIKTFKSFPLLRFDADNGVTLCRKCHVDIHKLIRERERKGFEKWQEVD